MTNGEHVKPESEAEKACFQLITDLDFVAAKVDGSGASRKYMKNEIWSLISYCGAPTWFVTFAPADIKHPICLYLADKKEKFSPEIYFPDDAVRLIASNPVAGAKFFNFMVKLFIDVVLNVNGKVVVCGERQKHITELLNSREDLHFIYICCCG